MGKILITNGAGFIGSTLVRHIINEMSDAMVVVDKLTYAGNLMSPALVVQSERFTFEKVDICDQTELAHAFTEYQPDCVMHPTAESHVDHSIDGPAAFIGTNVVRTYILLKVAWAYWAALAEDKKPAFRFHHISTDEVYDDLYSTGGFFTETTSYVPSSPYPASRASSNHLVHTWLRTYGLSTPITSCSNSCDPYHFPEELIPLMILNALADKPLPVCGNRQQIHDWLYVEDHARMLYCVAITGKADETYNIGGYNERKNPEVVEIICELLEELISNKPYSVTHYCGLIILVADCLGRDLHYVIDASKIAREFGWLPQGTSENGMCKTVRWYLANESWWKQVQDGSYRGEHLGPNS